jgi:hypothetical protein
MDTGFAITARLVGSVVGKLLLASVAGLHLTSSRLPGTVPQCIWFEHDVSSENRFPLFRIMLWITRWMPMRDLFSPLFRPLKKLHLGAALGVLFGLLAWGQPAEAANPLELNFWLSGPRYDGRVASCEAALPTITSQFQEKESTFWNSTLQITAYGRIHETAFRPWQSDNIPRRYCSADVMINDGKQRTVHYSIIEDGGFASFGQGVEWCVTGLDRNWAYNPRCTSARP